MLCARAIAGRFFPVGTHPGALESPSTLQAHSLPHSLTYPPISVCFKVYPCGNQVLSACPRTTSAKTVPSPQLVLDSELSYLLLCFCSLAEEAHFVHFFSGFLVYCTTPPAFGSNQVTYPSFEVQSPKLDPVVQGTIFCVKHKKCIMCLVSVQSCSCIVGRGIVTTLYLSTTVYFHRKPYPYFPSLWLVQLVYSLCVIP